MRTLLAALFALWAWPLPARAAPAWQWAEQFMDAALQKDLSPWDRDAITKSRKALDSASVNYPDPGRDWAHCQERMQAGFIIGGYSQKGPPRGAIYICSFMAQRSNNDQAQTIIHESAHLAGYESECDAVRVEAVVMDKGSDVHPHWTNNAAACGLRGIVSGWSD